MKSLIQFRDEFIYVTEEISGKTYVILQSLYNDGHCTMENVEEFLIIKGVRLSVDDLIEVAKRFCYYNKKYIIIHGEFMDVKKLFENYDIYIENDEIIPKKILKTIDIDIDIDQKSGYDDIYIKDNKVNGSDFSIPTEEWIAPTKKYTVSHSSETIYIDDNRYNENNIRNCLIHKGLISGGYLILIFGVFRTGNGKIFSPGFINKLMENQPISEINKSEEPKESKKSGESVTREIVGFKCEGKRAFIMYSDFTVEYNDNYDSPHPVLPTTCSNIIMKLDDEKMTLNCSGKIRHIKYSEVLVRWILSDDSIIMILGTDEKFTEIIRVRNPFLSTKYGFPVNNKLYEYTKMFN
jgi:hypothetical protein